MKKPKGKAGKASPERKRRVFVGTPNQTLRVGTGQVIGGARKKRVFVGMSGGVDSSVAAALLKKQGYNVVGVHLKCFNVDGCAERDAEDARRAAEHLDIPFYTFDYEKEYKQRVVDYMVAGYKKGITPNPDVMCNKEIKFGLFFDKAMELGADFVATGHYVRLVKSKKVNSKKSSLLHSPFNISLRVAADANKDQSYFLWTLKPEQLSRCLFPIGEYKKPQVRKFAEKFGLHNALKKDSQGICFLGQVDLLDFLKKYIKPRKGKILDIHGNELGEHHGAHFYTIGQRHGLSMGTRQQKLGTSGEFKPYYVADKDVKKNIVVVAEGGDSPALYKKSVTLTDVNLFAPVSSFKFPVAVQARVRYRQPLFKAVLSSANSPELAGKKTLKLVFAKPVKFVAAGQSAVFYRARRSLGKGGRQMEMLGGGIIK